MTDKLVPTAVAVVEATSGDPSSLLVAGLEVTSLLKAVVKKVFPSGDDNFQEGVAEEVRHVVFQEFPEVQQRVAALEDRVSPTAIYRILESFTYAFVNAEKAKRKALLNALKNAFDPALYDESLAKLAFEAIDKLTYGDLEYLTKVDAAGGAGRQPWKDRGDLPCFHADRLQQAGLVYREELNRGQSQDDVARITAMGKRVVKLIQDDSAGS